MAREPLRILLALRQRSIEQARQILGSCIKAEAELVDRIKSLDEALRRERAVSGDAQDLHEFGEMFAIRRFTVHADRRTAISALAEAELRSAEARGVVAEARTAAETVQQLIDERAASHAAEIGRQEQHTLDDITRPRAHEEIIKVTE